MPSVYAGTDIISCLRSKYIMRRQPYITSRQRYIIVIYEKLYYDYHERKCFHVRKQIA